MSNPMDDIKQIDNWIKERTLGQGSFGVVTLWLHRHSNERLAIKTCRWDTELTPKHRERWTKEVELLRTCTNENIVATVELPASLAAGLQRANPSRLPVLCMEFCSGGDLRKHLTGVDAAAGLQETQVRHILRDIKNAMQFLYKNKITHRDLKPENIVLKTDPREESDRSKTTYKLIDLGYAKEIDSQSVCASFVGTLEYLAPELLYSKTYSNSVDFWSFGLLTFEIICGVRPFLPHMSLVQCVPRIQKKSSEHICIYETYHGDLQYSKELFPENHISEPFKKHMEKWLRLALEYDPKLRGRDGSAKGVTFDLPTENSYKEGENKFGNLIIFSFLDDILSRKIIKVFSSYHLEHVAYEIDDCITASELKNWIERDTKIPVDKQVLLSPTSYAVVNGEDLVSKHWNSEANIMLYLVHKEELLKINIQPKLPKAIQRCLEQPKALYNYKNSKELYRCAMYFIMSEKDIYESLIRSCFVRAEGLKVEAKTLSVKQNIVDKEIGKLEMLKEVLLKNLTTSKENVQQLIENSGIDDSSLESLHVTFSKADESLDKLNTLITAWSTLNTRLISATRRCHELSSAELFHKFISKLNFQTLLIEMRETYLNYMINSKEKEFKVIERPCNDIVKISYNILKKRDKILQEICNQPYILQLFVISLEYSKISSIIDTASANAEKLLSEMSNVISELSVGCWDLIKKLATVRSDYADLPYSVVSFNKRNFKIGEPVTNQTGVAPVNGHSTDDEDLKSLLEESLKLQQLQNELTEKLNYHIIDIEKSYDFSFLEQFQ